MENTSYLYDTLVRVLSQHSNWLDLRHLKTLAWMMAGLIHSHTISLGSWTPFVISRAAYSASTVRRFRRWIDNDRIEVHSLYGPLIQEALISWVGKTIYVALDTSMLWDTYCIIRLSVVYRGRAVPMVWSVIEHGSSMVAFEAYKALLDRAAECLPFASKVVFLGDRGFADTTLMAYLKQLGWHFRIRIKSNFWVEHPQEGWFKVQDLDVVRGQARFRHEVWLTEKRFGPVHLAVALPFCGDDVWYVVSDAPTSVKTLKEYGLRFDIEENFLDDKSNGFQLESSLIRSAKALERLCFVLAATTLYLVSQGTSVVQRGKRRLVDPHWFRGLSYLKIGWKWVSYALSRGYELISWVYLSSACDPEPAIASKKQDQKRQCRFEFQFQEAA